MFSILDLRIVERIIRSIKRIRVQNCHGVFPWYTIRTSRDSDLDEDKFLRKYFTNQRRVRRGSS
jgi:hypothetical protein